MTQTNPGPAGNASAIDDDPLLHLHKMSTTAGVGSQEYVAVNVASVVAVLFGLASLLAIASPVLLIFPMVGVGLGLIALRQVRQSNGTQTGGGFAILGLVLSGVITAVIFSYQGWQAWHRRSDQLALAALCQKYGECLDQGKYAEAYDLFDANFQNRVGKPVFVIHLKDMEMPGQLQPRIDGISWNGLAEFHEDDAGVSTADSVLKIHYSGSSYESRIGARFKRVGDGPWLFDDIPDQFPPLKAPGAAGRQRQ